MVRVAALFTRANSVYRALGADCFDSRRDARTFDLACPVVVVERQCKARREATPARFAAFLLDLARACA